MRIALVTNNYFPYQAGVARSVDLTYRLLQHAGHEPFIITWNFDAKKHENDDHIIRLNGLLYILYKQKPMPIPPLHLTRTIFSIIHSIKPDVIHIHHPFLLGHAALQVGKKLQIPVVFTYHTQYEQYLHYVPGAHFFVRGFIQKRLRNVFNESAGIIFPSKTIEHDLRSRFQITRSTVIPTAIQEAFFYQRAQPLNSTDPLKLLTVSRFEKEKNIPFLLDAMRLLKDKKVHLTLAGYGSYLAYLQTYAYEIAGLSPEQVCFIKYPSRDQLIKLYQNADLFIFSSTTETQGLVLAEAMASSLPVIALRAPGACDSIEDGINGYLIENPQEMAERITDYKNNRAHLRSCAAHAYKTANHYRQYLFIQKIIDFYTSFL